MPPADVKGRGPDDPPEGAERLAELEAKVETYRSTLTDIYELYDKKIEELSLIRRLGDSLRTPLDLETLCRRIVEGVAGEITADRLALLLMDQDRGRLLVRAVFDASVEETEYFSEARALNLPPDEGPAGEALRTGRAVMAQAESVPFSLEPGDEDPVSLLFIPLSARDTASGLLAPVRSAGNPFTEDDVRILSIIADQAATALANVQLFGELAAANVRLQESERQARQTSLYLESLLEAAGDVIFTLNQEGVVTYVNRKVTEWGWDKDELVGRPLADFLADPTGLPGSYEGAASFLTKNGRQRETLLSTSSVPAADGDGAAFLVLARDVTERRQLERQLFHSEKLASIGILAAGVAHEIGNPLSAISGYTQILQSGGVDDEEAGEYLAGIESQAARIQRIIEDLLNYSRPGKGVRSKIDLAQAVPSVLNMLTAQSAFRGLEVSYDLDPEVPNVEMDPDHLAQLVVNIAINSAQASPEGVSLKAVSRAEAGKVKLVLADNGPGIPEDRRARIFDPFFTTKSVGQGTGLGLAICHRIVENAGGSIEVTEADEGGAAFVIRLPAAGEES